MVGNSGGSLARFERGRPRLSREQKRVRAVLAARWKVDVAGLWLKRRIEAGVPLDSRSLYIQDDELANLAVELDLTE